MGDMLTHQLLEDTNIASRAMKAVFHRGIGAARRTRDLEAEQLVKEKFGDQGQLVTRRLFIDASGPVHRRAQKANEMYQYHMRSTLPHTDDGSRLLPNNLYFEYTQTMGRYEHEIRNLDQEILLNYDALVQKDVSLRNVVAAQQNKPQTASAADYPTPEQMKRYLYVEWRLEPVATANDFRYQVDESVKQRLEESLKQVAADAKADIFARMAEPMKRFVEKLSVPIGEKGSIFRDSLIENLNELVDTLPKLNFDDDPRVKEVVEELRKLVTPYVYNPSALREQPEVRQSARDKMAELQKRLEGYGWKDL